MVSEKNMLGDLRINFLIFSSCKNNLTVKIYILSYLNLTRMLSQVASVYHLAVFSLPCSPHFFFSKEPLLFIDLQPEQKLSLKSFGYNSDSRGRKYCDLLKHFHNKNAHFKLEISVR